MHEVVDCGCLVTPMSRIFHQYLGAQMRPAFFTPLDTHLKRAATLTEKLTLALHDRPLGEASSRMRAGIGCLGVTLEHQNAVVALLERQPPISASAFVLARSVFESYIRGTWLLMCATDAQVESFLRGDDPPNMPVLIGSIEAVLQTEERQLLNTYKNDWNAMCDFTHTGGLQIQRWNTPEAIEPSYEETELVAVLEFTAAIALLAATGIASHINERTLALGLLEFGRSHFA
jgi:hypothetical protein